MNPTRKPTPERGVERIRWTVTSRQLDVRRVAGRQPWGVRHARRTGADPLTACGEWAAGGPMFWHLPFDAAVQEPCPACWHAVVMPAASRVQSA